MDSNMLCCPSHQTATLIEDHHAGDLICPECGLVVGDRVIDVSAEWPTFSNSNSYEVDPNLCDDPDPLLNDSNLPTFTSSVTEAVSFDECQTNSNSDRFLKKAFEEISEMGCRINLSKAIINRASFVFKQLYKNKCLRGRSNDAKATACLYIACRQEGVPRTFKELCSISKVSKKEIGRCFKKCLEALENDLKQITTTDFMSRFCSYLDLPNGIQCAATHIAIKAVEMDIVGGRSPVSVAAAAIYMASQASEHKRSKKQIGDIAGVAESTIRESYKELYPHARNLFPEYFIFKTPINSLPSI